MGIPRAAAARPSKACVAQNGQGKCPCRVGILHIAPRIDFLLYFILSVVVASSLSERESLIRVVSQDVIKGLVHVGQHQDASDGASKLRLSRTTPWSASWVSLSIAPLLCIFFVPLCFNQSRRPWRASVRTDTKRSNFRANTSLRLRGGQPDAF